MRIIVCALGIIAFLGLTGCKKDWRETCGSKDNCARECMKQEKCCSGGEDCFPEGKSGQSNVQMDEMKCACKCLDEFKPSDPNLNAARSHMCSN